MTSTSSTEPSSSPVRLGVIGAAGSMAGAHIAYFKDIPGLTFAAAADVPDAKDRLDKLADEHGCKTYTDASAMLSKASGGGDIDAVLIACPHYDHPRYAMEAFDAGVHVLCEKPVAVTAEAAAQVNDAYAAARKRHPGLLFAGMFNQRTNPAWKEIHRLCHDGSLGELVRVSWTITTWFRTQAYYDSGGWRATWAGEGGGVLINQCPHNLDLLQWFVGMPSRVTALASLGKFHHIEVEDDITALLEFPNGATGTFITSTGQTPGINRLEIVGDRGTLISDGHRGEGFTFLRAERPVSEFTQTTPDRFGNVPVTEITLKSPKAPHGEHESITRNFIQTVAGGGTQSDLIAPGIEMIHGLELGNAMLLSGLQQTPISLPTDRPAFTKLLNDLKNNSTFKKNEVKETAPAGMGTSY